MSQVVVPVPTPSAPRGWVAFGWLTHALFGVTVVFLYRFLRGVDVPPNDAANLRTPLFDAALALQFAVGHSLLLLPSVRQRLTRFVPSPAYGVFFCCCTCLSLLVTITAWRPWGGAVWQLAGWPRVAMLTAFFASWAALFYSLHLSGFGYQTGWTTWRPWSQGKPQPRREFQPRGAYLLFRHPVYLSFLGLIWFTPCMTYDRAVLTAFWSVYIFYGSYLKDRRLLFYLGDRYRAYQSEVPGYPGVPIGPLGRVSWQPPSESLARTA